MTNKEIYIIFMTRYPNMPIDDYRPLSNIHRPKGQGITLWTDNGDMILYFPKEGEQDG